MTSGSASAVFAGNSLTVQQGTDDVVLNWQSFNVSADGTVTFRQPSAGAIALNQIYQADPSRIFGALKADGRVYLLNQNGIIFGERATVDVGGLLASTLQLTPQALTNGIAGAINDVSAPNSPAFQKYTNGLPSQPIVVESGASITTAEGGQVFMFAPQIEQRGEIRTPGGQTMLAAGTTVYLAASNDDNLRGLLVEVDAANAREGSVTNGPASGSALADKVGRIIAERGNITLAGLAVNQNGRVSATTSVRANGSIRLQARTGTIFSTGGGASQRGVLGGDLTVGAGTYTDVQLDDDATDTTVDANAQPRSSIALLGGTVEILDGSRITATGGDIVVKAQQAQASTTFGTTPDTGTPPDRDASRVYVAPGAVLDVSGASVDLPMERNVLRVELRANQVRDSPVQRDGPLRGKAVFVDIRRSGTRDDGSVWQGTPLADVSGDISTIARSVAERNLVGGSVVLQAQGDVIVAPGAAVDVSGGIATYADGFINTTRLLADNGSVVDIGQADPNRTYVGIVNGYVRQHQRWGVTETFTGFPGLSPGAFESGYVEGYDAGDVGIVAPHVILDGDLKGAVAVGPYQRQPTAPLAAGSSRPYSQLPRGASLALGRQRQGAPDFTLDPLIFVPSGSVLPTLLNAQGLPFDPRADELPTTVDRTVLRTELFAPGRIADATVFNRDSITLAADQSLALPAGGALSLSAPRIELDGSIDIPAGTFAATAQLSSQGNLGDPSLLSLGATARLTLRGRWVNDDERAGGDRFAPPPLWIDGGSVNLSTSAGDLLLANGSSIDVSGGAYRRATGAVVGGRGGSIALATSPIPNGDRGLPVRLEFGAKLDAYALFEGGTLSVTASEICISAAVCDGGTANALNLPPEAFTHGGFGHYDLRTNRDGISLEGSTPLLLRQQNLVLGLDNPFRPSSPSLADLAHVATLDDLLRRPTDLDLRVSAPAPAQAYTESSFLTAPMLRLAAGARIEGDPDATINLRSNTRIAIDGTIAVPSGTVAMLLDQSLSVSEFIDAQAIRLGERATIDLRGVPRIAPNEIGARNGTVLDGGDLSLRAIRGYIVTSPGSRIDVSGATGMLDLRVAENDIGLTPTQIGSAAGTISFRAAEGMVLSGQLTGEAGTGSSVAGLRPRGGTLEIALDPFERNDPAATQSAPSLFPTGARTITLVQHAEQLAVGPDTPVPADFNGQARVAADGVIGGGFDSLTLESRLLSGVDSLFRFFDVPGAIAVDGNVALTLPGRLTLESARFDAARGNASLEAPYVTLGNTDPNWSTLLVPTTGAGSLAVRGDFVELTGRYAIDGAASTSVTSRGDLRLRGVELPVTVGQGIVGSFVTAGDMALSASQVYATTLTDFELAVRNNPLGVLTVTGNGAAPKDLLSAASRLRLTAPTIEQAGTLRAPFGTIELTGDRVSLLPGSETSTSSSGLVVPFGVTQGGFAWAYDLANLDFIYGSGQRPPPAQTVSLQGRLVDIRAGATIDLSGGGDLLAYEFLPGVGGSRDVLSASVRPDEFAIVPNLQIDVAPFDQREYVGSPLRAGDSVFLEAGSDLPAGEYVLLPARYSLLPGAFLVRGVDGYQDAVPGEAFARLDGSTVVAGYRALAGTGTATSGTRRTGFAVRSADLARREAEYTTTSADAFFARDAANNDVLAPRLPRDAGVLVLNSTESLLLDGGLRAHAAAGGRGAAVDVTSALLRVAAGGGAATMPGEVVIDADKLNALGAESVLLGGHRTMTNDGISIDVGAERVTIAADTAIELPELLISARDTLLVDSGASLTGSATAGGAGDSLFEPQRYLLSGDGALLRVTSGAQAVIERSNETGARGTLDIRDGTTLTAGAGAILLDASRNSTVLGKLALAGGSLNVGASSITLGTGGVAASGLVLGADDLAELAIDQLVLTSRSTVDLAGDIRLGLNRLVINAGGLRNVGGGSSSITATEAIRLTNTTHVGIAPTVGGGTLRLDAAAFELGRGTFVFDGFARVELAASGALTFEDGARLTTAGDFAWNGAYLTGVAGARAGIQATGALSLGRTGSSAAIPADLELGARLDIAASRIRDDALIVLPGGTVSLHATGETDVLVPNSGSIALGADAAIDVRGLTRLFDAVPVAAAGGRVTLTADLGDVGIATGAVVDVRGSEAGGDAGGITILAGRGDVALDGLLLGQSVGSRGGSLDIDALSFGGYAAVANQVGPGGFTEVLRLRQRGVGDLVLSGAPLRVHELNVVADRGGVSVGNDVDASGEEAGRVRLVAQGPIIIDGSIRANATGDEQHGGAVELLTAAGGVHVAPNAPIDVAGGPGGKGGTILLRVPSSTLIDTLLDSDPGNDGVVLSGALNGARQITLEGYQAYDDADGILSPEELAAVPTNPRFADAALLMENDAPIRAALGRASDSTFHLVPGVEIRSIGDLALAADWNMFTWRFANDVPGELTLRAGGDLIFNGSLSDGFAALTGNAGFQLSTTSTGESWDYRLVGGASALSADPLAVHDELEVATLGAGRGDVVLRNGSATAPRMVRTGTGAIEIAAARDFVLGNQQSVVYTAGVSGPGIRFGAGNNTLGSRAYPIDGGDVSIMAGRNVLGAPTNQFVNYWLYRVGSPAIGGPSSAVGWTVNFQRFEQNVGALGGGDVRVTAGGDIRDFSASLPSIGRQVGGTTLDTSIVEIVGGGALDVEAGGNIFGGSYYVGLGTAGLRAGDDIGRYTRSDGTTSLAPLFGLGNSTLAATARGDLDVEAVANATLLPPGLAQLPLAGNRRTPYYSTYTDATAAQFVSVAGDLSFAADDAVVTGALSSMAFLAGSADALGLRIAPPTIRAAALSGDVTLNGTLALFPAPKGNLELFAQTDVARSDAPGTALLALSDAPVDALPSVRAPQLSTATLTLVAGEGVPQNLVGSLHSPVPVHADANQPDGVADLTPARIVAATGDIDLTTRGVGDTSRFYFAKAARVVAGRDLIDLSLQVQHLRDTDLTVMQAGRDVRYTAARNSFGSLQVNQRSILVEGPGLLEVTAGRDIDLQTSQGIVTRGNLENHFLPDGGASMSLIAGLGETGAPAFEAFIQGYLGTDSKYATELIAYVERVTGDSGLTFSAARERFLGFPRSQQWPLVERLFLAELRTSGRKAAVSGNRDDFADAFTALETLFPGSNPDTENGETNAYHGDVRLFFSALYTLADGDVSVFAPGGEVNVGLATPPTAFGVSKAASQLGIVAQRAGDVTALAYSDFLVNESRVFAADGGNILVWSTQGDIDAGRGAKTAISAPPPRVTIDENGRTIVQFPAALTGSGIQTLATSHGKHPGDVDLFAPRGVVNAGDAGIVAGNLTIAATAVLGADNISVSGVSVGVPVDTGGFATALTGVSAVAASAANTAEQAVTPSRQQTESETPLAAQALGFLDVFITGFGEQCDPKKEDCGKDKQQ